MKHEWMIVRYYLKIHGDTLKIKPRSHVAAQLPVEYEPNFHCQ